MCFRGSGKPALCEELIVNCSYCMRTKHGSTVKLCFPFGLDTNYTHLQRRRENKPNNLHTTMSESIISKKTSPQSQKILRIPKRHRYKNRIRKSHYITLVLLSNVVRAVRDTPSSNRPADILVKGGRWNLFLTNVLRPCPPQQPCH